MQLSAQPVTASRTAFVTGGSGFVGSRLITLLVSRGWQVRALAGQVSELESPEGVLLARISPLPSLNGEVHAVLLRSVDAVVAPYRQLQVLLAIITVAGVLQAISDERKRSTT